MSGYLSKVIPYLLLIMLLLNTVTLLAGGSLNMATAAGFMLVLAGSALLWKFSSAAAALKPVRVRRRRD